MADLTQEPFERDFDRYIVLKTKDLERLPEDLDRALHDIIVFQARARINRGVSDDLKALVIESDWPEYEPAWKMIEERVERRA